MDSERGRGNPEAAPGLTDLAQTAFSTPGTPTFPLDAFPLDAFPLDAAECARRVREALIEDRADEDITTRATIAPDRRSDAAIVARRPGVVCGTPLAVETLRQCDPSVVIHNGPSGNAGTECHTVERGATVLRVAGNTRALLAAERVALNFMQRLSGIATLTAQYVNAVRGTGARILDTRKTTPGWRALEKYAVRCGGGFNHRNDLAQAVLIKDNHLAALGGDIVAAVERARAVAASGTRVEVECDRLEQVSVALAAGADIIMLDNMGLHDMKGAVRMVGGRAVVEASGGVNLQTVRGIAETGVDWISVGALTHSAPALDIALDFD